MTPQEKAKELFDRYYNQIDKVVIDRFVALQEHEDCAKACALIAVDEIIDENEAWALALEKAGHDSERRPVKYWQQVQAEIEKL